MSRSISIATDIGRVAAEDQAEGKVPFSVYKSYFLAGAGNCCVLFLLLLVFLASQGVTSGSDYFMTFWTQQEFLRYHMETTIFTTEQCLYLYAGLILAVILVSQIVLWVYLAFVKL